DGVAALRVLEIAMGLALQLWPRLGHVADDADDGHPRSGRPILAKALADRALVRAPILLRQRLVDDRDLRCVVTVLGREVAAGRERNPHRAEVAGHRDAVLGVRQRLSRAGRLPLDMKGAAPAVASHRKWVPTACI